MKRSQTQVSDWMTRDPITIAPGALLADAYELMRENEIRRLLVVDDELVGIITLSDILRTLPGPLQDPDDQTRLLMVTRKVWNVMTDDPVTVDPEDTIQEAAERMLEYQVSGLPVITGGQPVGIITESDIFRLVVESWAEESTDGGIPA
jgi:acetoin utilization protein AcuB